MERSTHPPPDSITLTQEMRGQELEDEVKVWKEIAASEARIKLIQEMVKVNVAFADLEHFGQEIFNKFKSEKLKSKAKEGNLTDKVTRPIMMMKRHTFL